MTWVRLDENFPDHPKIVGLSDRAYRCFVNSLCYANRHLTDGNVSVSAQHYLHCTKLIATQLVRVGLWEIAEHGAFLIHDYHAYQPTRKEIVDRRETRAEAGRLGGIAKARNRLRLVGFQEKSPETFRNVTQKPSNFPDSARPLEKPNTEKRA